MSRIGRLSITLPEKVSLNADASGHVVVEGPKGKLEYDVPKGVNLSQEDGVIQVTRASENRQLKAMHGTVRALVSNMIQGVSAGFVKQLEIQGVGYRAAVKGKDLDLQLGYSHPLLHPIPDGLAVTVTNNTEITIEGIDKQMVGQFAAEVRSYRRPEPYKGKGIRYKGEKVRRKAGKSVK